MREGGQITRPEYERMGLDVPNYVASRDDAPGEKHFLLAFMFVHWDPDAVVHISLRGELACLESVVGGTLNRDAPEAFDDELAEETLDEAQVTL